MLKYKNSFAYGASTYLKSRSIQTSFSARFGSIPLIKSALNKNDQVELNGNDSNSVKSNRYSQ